MELYVYGVIKAAEATDDWPDQGVMLVRQGDLVALVKPADKKDVQLDPAALLAHQRVLEAAMAGGTVVPCAFGTVAAGEEDVKRLLNHAAVSLNEALRRLEGKEEVGIKAFWLKEAIASEVEREMGDLARLQERAADPKQGRQVAIAVGQRVEACVERWKATLVPRIMKELREYCDDMRLNEPFGQRMLMNAAFLVDRGRAWAFAEKVHQLDARYGDRLEFKYVSGLPPYNFTDIRISLAGA